MNLKSIYTSRPLSTGDIVIIGILLFLSYIGIFDQQLYRYYIYVLRILEVSSLVS